MPAARSRISMPATIRNWSRLCAGTAWLRRKFLARTGCALSMPPGPRTSMRVLALILAAAAANAQIKIAVNQTTIESAPVFLAERLPGVELVPVPNGRVAMEQLLHGTVDAA